MILGIHHAQITIPKGREQEARAFYCGALGLNEVPKPESLQGRGGLWLKVVTDKFISALKTGLNEDLQKRI